MTFNFHIFFEICTSQFFLYYVYICIFSFLAYKSTIIAKATTIINLFNDNPVYYTNIKTTVDKLKDDGHT